MTEPVPSDRATRPGRLLLGIAVTLLLVSALLAWFDRGLTSLLVPLSEMRAVIGVLSVLAAYAAVRKGNAGTSRMRVAAMCGIGGVASAAYAIVPMLLLASGTTVHFTSAGVDLVGTWYVPRSSGPHGAIVVVHGSGSMTRRVYRAWAIPFLKAGMSVLVYDKRGVGDSRGRYEERRNTSPANIELLATDAAAAMAFVARHPDIDRERIGYFGISQAGWIVPRALHMDSSARFAVLLGGSTVSVGEQNFFNELAGDDHLGFRDPALPLDTLNARVNDRNATGFDPRSDIGSLAVPVLWVFGSRDTSTPAAKSMTVIDSIRHATAHRLSARVFDGANHIGMIVRGTGASIPPDFAPGLWTGVVAWIQDSTRVPYAALERKH